MQTRFLTLVLVVASFRCGAQNAPAKASAQIPDSVLYDAFLYRVSWIDALADKLTAQGKKSAVAIRSTIRKQAGLTGPEEAALRDIAKDWNNKNLALVTAAKALAKPGVSTNSPAVQNLMNQRQEAAMSSIGQLQARFGPLRFQALDTFIRSTATLSAVPAGTRPAPRGRK